MRNSGNRFKPTELQCAVWSCVWVLWETWTKSLTSRHVFNRISWHEVSCGNSSTPVGFGPEGCTVTAVCLCCTLLGTQFLVNRHKYHWYIEGRAGVCTQTTNMRLYAKTLNLLTYLVTLWKRSFTSRIFLKRSRSRSTIIAALQLEVCPGSH